MTDTVVTRHRVSGAVDVNTPLHIAQHPVLGRNLEIVPEGTKPFVPELHKPSKPEPVVSLPKLDYEDIKAEARSEKPAPDKKNGKD